MHEQPPHGCKHLATYIESTKSVFALQTIDEIGRIVKEAQEPVKSASAKVGDDHIDDVMDNMDDLDSSELDC